MFSFIRTSRNPHSVKLALLGKGGSGKSALAALLARCFAERGWKVLAADLDTNPGLAVSLGLPAADAPLPPEAVAARRGSGYGWGLAPGLTPAGAVERFAVPVARGAWFLGAGNIGRARDDLARSVAAVLEIAAGFDAAGWVTIADMEAGPTWTCEGPARFADLALVCVEPTPASRLAARRIVSNCDHDGTPAGLVLTKARDGDPARTPGDLAPLLGSIPFDPAVRRLERRDSLWELAGAGPALNAARGLAESIESMLDAEAPQSAPLTLRLDRLEQRRVVRLPSADEEEVSSN